MPNEFTIVLGLLGLLATLIGMQWRFFSSLDKRFADLKDFINLVKDEFINKLEYHERHDDRRFTEINDNVWLLRLRNAARDGLKADQWLEDKKISQMNDLIKNS